jgi:flagellar assembly protein FliH
MSSSSRFGPFPNVPPPDNDRPSSPYARFIPREELGEFSAWNPDALSGATARESAAPPVTDADQQAQVASARQAGYQDGYRDGLVALEGFKQSFAAQLAGQVGKLIDSVDAQFESLEAQMAQAVAQSALSLARQVVRAELQTHPEVVARVAGEAVRAVLLSARHITLHAHPLDVPLIEQGAADALSARQARVIADDRIERGGCRIESDLGAIDARIGARWAQAASSFAGETPWSDDGDEVEA